MLLAVNTMDGQQRWLGEPAKSIPCFRCGLCCVGFLVKVSNQDLGLLSRALGTSKAGLFRKYVRKTPVGPVLRQHVNNCVFLECDAQGFAACAVYESRPEVCRSWVPSLHRPECQEGLRRVGYRQRLLLPGDMYPAEEAAAKLISLIAGKAVDI